MTRDCHAGICGSPGVRFPRATRLIILSDWITNSRKPRRLSPSEKYELFVSVLTGHATQREAAAKWKADRSTVVHICRIAKQGALDALSASVPGRPGMTAEQAALAEARAELERLRATVTSRRWRCTCGREKQAGTDGRPGPGERSAARTAAAAAVRPPSGPLPSWPPNTQSYGQGQGS